MMRRRKFLLGGLAATLAASGTAADAAFFERHDLEVVRVPLSLGLSRPLRVGLMADIHFDPLYETGYIEGAFRILSSQSPDLLLLAGDYATHTPARLEEFSAIAGKFLPPHGIYASMGNHDHWSGADKVQKLLEGGGIHVLRNDVSPLPENRGWMLAGLDSFWAGRPDRTLFARQPAGTRFIALVHEPDAWHDLRHPGIRLQVSGHTHGGQVRAPFMGALMLPSWGKHYDAGLFERPGQSLYVNRGLGTVRIPCRWNCRPEITLFELT